MTTPPLSPARMPLTAVPSGRSVVVRGIDGGCGAALRMASLGLLPGAAIHVHRNDRNGPVVVGVHGGRVMLGRHIAERVSVQEAGT